MRTAMLVFAVACGSTPSPRILEPPVRQSELVAAIRRTECLGTCPVYVIAVYRDGRVEYDGEAHVTTKGRASRRIQPDQLAELERRLTPDLALLEGNYTTHDCTDHPSVTIWYRPVGGPTRTIEHYLGMSRVPQGLSNVEANIDHLLEAARWTGMRVPMIGGCE